jgi:hypothetical protein
MEKGRERKKDKRNRIKKICKHMRYFKNIVLKFKPKMFNRIKIRGISRKI